MFPKDGPNLKSRIYEIGSIILKHAVVSPLFVFSQAMLTKQKLYPAENGANLASQEHSYKFDCVLLFKHCSCACHRSPILHNDSMNQKEIPDSFWLGFF